MNDIERAIQDLKECVTYKCEPLQTTADLAIQALEKQIPKKTIKLKQLCPMCKSVLKYKQTYCKDCGQKLDWSGEDDR